MQKVQMQHNLLPFKRHVEARVFANARSNVRFGQNNRMNTKPEYNTSIQFALIRKEILSSI